jgi:hypothetical protein
MFEWSNPWLHRFTARYPAAKYRTQLAGGTYEPDFRESIFYALGE